MEDLFNDPYAWQIVHGSFFSVDNMTDEEVQEAIFNDVLVAQYSNMPFNWYDLFRFIGPSTMSSYHELPRVMRRINRVLNLLVSDTVMNLISINGDSITIREGRVYHQAAMDAAGFWPEGFDAPPGVNVIRITDEGREMFDQLGAEGLADLVMMDMMATTDISRTVQ